MPETIQAGAGSVQIRGDKEKIGFFPICTSNPIKERWKGRGKFLSWRIMPPKPA